MLVVPHGGNLYKRTLMSTKFGTNASGVLLSCGGNSIHTRNSPTDLDGNGTTGHGPVHVRASGAGRRQGAQTVLRLTS